MDNKTPVSQTLVGAVAVAVLAGLIVWLVTGRQVVRVEVVNAASITTAPQPRDSEPEAVVPGAPEPRSTVKDTSLPPSCIEAVIHDADHYTNVRVGPGTNYEVATRILEGEVFCVTSQRGRWWTVRTANGIMGYIYYDRVRVVSSR